MAATLNDKYETVTNSIIASLEQGVAPWTKPWVGSALPSNAVSGRSYHGINILILWSQASVKGYTSNQWLTYNQAKKAGGNVKAGEKGTSIVLWKFLKKDEEDDNGKTVTRTIPLLKLFTVFNVEQTENVNFKAVDTVEKLEDGTEEAVFVRADEFIKSTNATIRSSNGRAFFSPSEDFIGLPNKDDFRTPTEYYAVAFHELGHWTGHTSRLDRTQCTVPFTQDYAFEELVAELTSAFVCADFGFEGKVQHPEYIAAWIKHLSNDHRAIFRAAKQATLAAAFLHETADSDEGDLEASA